jgi:NitT/TauT family transport system ATP-binding protein
VDRPLECDRREDGRTAVNAQAVELTGVGLRFGSFTAVRGVDLSVPPGEFTAIVGPTGCGKSSLLNLVAGLLGASEGRVLVFGRQVAAVNREAAYMFQQDALLPWKSAVDNVALGPRLRGVRRDEADRQARGWLRRVGLEGFEDRFPHQLSGGQRKRVAMAQALINRLPLLLMDESFSALDVQTRALMENELLGLWSELKPTVLFVTHDLEEAIAMADRVILMTAGPAATVKADYEVPLPRPRNVAEARFTPGFEELYGRIWEDLRAEVMRTYERSREQAD